MELHSLGSAILVRSIEVVKVYRAKLPELQQLVDAIAESGASLNTPVTFGGSTTYPIVRASYAGLLTVVTRLLCGGADVRVVAGSSAATMESALSAAVRSDKRVVLHRLLIAADAVHEQTRGLRVQALWQCFMSNNVDAAELLLAHGAAVDDNFTSLLWLMEKSVAFVRFALRLQPTRRLCVAAPPPWNGACGVPPWRGEGGRLWLVGSSD